MNSQKDIINNIINEFVKELKNRFFFIKTSINKNAIYQFKDDEIDRFTKDYLKADLNTAKKVKWTSNDTVSGRVCPNCGNISYYCATSRDIKAQKQPDSYCSKCGQKFIIE